MMDTVFFCDLISCINPSMTQEVLRAGKDIP
jgi:hypothetical protein